MKNKVRMIGLEAMYSEFRLVYLQNMGVIRFDGHVGRLINYEYGKHTEIYLDNSKEAIEDSKEKYSMNILPKPYVEFYAKKEAYKELLLKLKTMGKKIDHRIDFPKELEVIVRKFIGGGKVGSFY